MFLALDKAEFLSSLFLEIFTMDTSHLPVKGVKFRPMLVTYGHGPSSEGSKQAITTVDNATASFHLRFSDRLLPILCCLFTFLISSSSLEALGKF